MKKIKTITLEMTKADLIYAIKLALIEYGEITEDDKITVNWEVQDTADDRFNHSPHYEFTTAKVKVERKE